MYERIMQEIALSGFKSIREVERLANVSYGTIRNTKYGHTPKSDSLSRIAKVLGVSADYLLTGVKDDGTNEPPEIKQKRMQILSILDGLSESQYENAIHYLTYLKGLDSEK